MLKNQQGSALLLAIVMFAALFGLLGITLDQSTRLYSQVQQAHTKNMALHLAEAGLEFSLYLIQSGTTASGDNTFELETGSAVISISEPSPSGQIEIISTGIPKGRTTSPSLQSRIKLVVSPGDDGNFFVHAREELL